MASAGRWAEGLDEGLDVRSAWRSVVPLEPRSGSKSGEQGAPLLRRWSLSAPFGQQSRSMSQWRSHRRTRRRGVLTSPNRRRIDASWRAHSKAVRRGTDRIDPDCHDLARSISMPPGWASFLNDGTLNTQGKQGQCSSMHVRTGARPTASTK